MKKDSPIGIFDSGVGGLTVVKEIINLLPREDIIYLGDTARVPYGIRSAETVTRYAIENTEFLLSKNIKALVVACNTVSAVGLDELRKRIEIPVIGVLEPGARAAVRTTRNGVVGVIGTEATISSSSYKRTIQELAPQITVYGKACPLFVPLVEEGWIEGEIVQSIVDKYMEEMRRLNIDTLVLGCTHYPLLRKAIQRSLGERVSLIDSAVETASTLRTLLLEEGLAREYNILPGRLFYVTDAPERFKRIGRKFIGDILKEVEKVSVPLKDSVVLDT